MDDSLVRMIVLLPGVGFDRIGWLMKLKKGTSITDDQGLDAIPDLDKSFRKSKKRLQAALGEMLKVVDFCIKRANEIQVV